MKTENTKLGQKQMTLAEFIAKHGLTMSATYAGKREEKWKGAEKPWKFFLWHCQIKKGAAVMDQEYRMGEGHITIKPALPKGMRAQTIAGEEWIKRYGKPTPPDLAGVLDSLVSDAEALGLTFEDWASELGYDEDSRDAERIYHACVECGRKLRQLLGREALRELQQCERL